MRKQINIIDGQLIMFREGNEVFHLEQFFGREHDYNTILPKYPLNQIWTPNKQ